MRLGYSMRASGTMLCHPIQGAERLRGRIDRRRDLRELAAAGYPQRELYGAAEDWAHRTGIRCRWKSKPQEVVLNREQATALFRIFQEILTNISRHARASNVTCSFKTTVDELTLKVSDDGKGFNPAKLSDRKSLGLLGMRERAVLFSGRLEIQSTTGKGTTVAVHIPLGRDSGQLAGNSRKRAP